MVKYQDIRAKARIRQSSRMTAVLDGGLPLSLMPLIKNAITVANVK